MEQQSTVKYLVALPTNDNAIITFLTQHVPKWCSEAAIKASLEQPQTHTFLAMHQDRVIGVLLCTAVFEDADVLMIVVSPNFRNQGVATKLMQFGISSLMQIKATRMFLEVRESNQVARNFYHKMGFLVLSKRRQYYSNPIEDGVVMSLEFNDIGWNNTNDYRNSSF